MNTLKTIARWTRWLFSEEKFVVIPDGHRFAVVIRRAHIDTPTKHTGLTREDAEAARTKLEGEEWSARQW